MKKFISLVLVAAAAMMVFSSCSEKQNPDPKKDDAFYLINLNITSAGDATLPDAIKKIFDNYTNEVTSIVSSANTELKSITVQTTAESKFYDTKKLVEAARNKYENELTKCTDKAKRTVTPGLTLYCSSDTKKEISYAEFPLKYENK